MQKHDIKVYDHRVCQHQVNSKIDEIRSNIKSIIGVQKNLVDEFLVSKKKDDSKFNYFKY